MHVRFGGAVGCVGHGAAGPRSIEQNHIALLAAGSAAAWCWPAEWADAHELDSGSDEYQPLIQRACAYGAAGTPEVSEYCAVEVGALTGTGLYGGPGVDR